MEIITNGIDNKDLFAEKIYEFIDWCNEAYLSTAFFTDDTMIRILSNQNKKVTLIVSLRFPTCPTALRRVSGLKNVNLYYAGNEFHSKLYCFSKDNKVKASIGSSNLTAGGFYKNIETNVLITDSTGETCLNNFILIKNKSYQLTPSILDEYEEKYNSYKNQPDIKIKTKIKSISEDKEYNKLWAAIDYIAKLVARQLVEHYPEIPKYLVIDHFWHFIVAEKLGKHEAITLKMQTGSREEYLKTLFTEYVNWEESNEDNLAAIYSRSKELSIMLNSKNKLRKDEFKKVFMTLHSSHNRAQRFHHDVKFIEMNHVEKLNSSIRHLVDENIPLDDRVNDLLHKEFELKYFGKSAVREFNGWCYPEKYPIRNDKADAALKILGF